MNSDNKQISQQASKSHVSGTKPESTKASQRRPAQLALTQVPIDIAAFGTTFFLVKIFYRDEADSTDYVVASYKRALDKLRVTIKGEPMIAPEVLDQGLVRVNLSGLTGRLWQNGNNVIVIFNADAIALAEHS